MTSMLPKVVVSEVMCLVWQRAYFQALRRAPVSMAS
jgi:hypothetical protein